MTLSTRHHLKGSLHSLLAAKFDNQVTPRLQGSSHTLHFATNGIGFRSPLVLHPHDIAAESRLSLDLLRMGRPAVFPLLLETAKSCSLLLDAKKRPHFGLSSFGLLKEKAEGHGEVLGVDSAVLKKSGFTWRRIPQPLQVAAPPVIGSDMSVYSAQIRRSPYSKQEARKLCSEAGFEADTPADLHHPDAFMTGFSLVPKDKAGDEWMRRLRNEIPTRTMMRLSTPVLRADLLGSHLLQNCWAQQRYTALHWEQC